MKRLGLVLLFAMFVSVFSFAQDRGGQRNFDPEAMAKRQTETLKEKLGLDKDQEKKIHDINLDSLKKMAELREEAQGGGGFSAIREDMMAIRKKQDADIKKVLTEDQVEKYDKYLEERKKQRGQRGRR